MGRGVHRGDEGAGDLMTVPIFRRGSANAMITVALIMTMSATGASIDVYPAERAGQPIDRRLFGKFTEHLWENVYNGMWAQVLRNPGFEPDENFGNAQSVRGRMARVLAGLSAQVAPESYQGMPLWWVRFGRGEGAVTAVGDAFNSQGAVRIAATSLATPQFGVAQPIYLPAHRQRRYEFSIAARGSAPGGMVVAIRNGGEGFPGVASATIAGPGEGWRKYTCTLDIPAGELRPGEAAILSIALTQPGEVLLDQAFLFPADHVDGFDPDVIRHLRDSKLPLLRWPGGNFVSSYHWEDGIGPADERPTRPNPAWAVTEPNHVGTDEFMTFCRHVGCEPMICLNAGDGTPEEAARWVEYCNGGPETEQGKRRAANGHPEPYNVSIWEIGNEIYGRWQVGHCDSKEYARRYRAFYEAMRAIDPTIRFIANGHDEAWNAELIKADPDILRSLSVHPLTDGGMPQDADPVQSYLGWMSYAHGAGERLRRLRAQMRAGGIEPRIAVTELQIMRSQNPLPGHHNQTEALVLSGFVNAAIRSGGEVELITHSALVNHGGGLRKQFEIVYPNPVHWAHQLYSTQPGTWPVRAQTACETFSVERFHGLPAGKDIPYLDTVALADGNGEVLSLLVTNRHPDEAIEATIRLHGFAAGKAVVRTLAGDSFLARNTWDQPDEVKIEESDLRLAGDQLTHSFAPHSLNCVLVRRAPGM